MASGWCALVVAWLPSMVAASPASQLAAGAAAAQLAATGAAPQLAADGAVVQLAAAGAAAQLAASGGAVEGLALGLPDDIEAAAIILASEDRRSLGEDLFRLLGDDSAAVRGRAALAVGRVGLPQAYPRLLGMLRDADGGVRALAAFAVGLLELDLEPATIAATRSRIVARLVEALDDADPRVVVQAMGALGAHADAVATPAVTAVLLNPDSAEPVVLAALAAWSRLPGAAPRPVEPWLGVASATQRRAAATALRRLNDPNALPALTGALEDPDPRVRAAAIRGVHSAPISVTERFLIPALRDDDWRVACAALQWVTALWRRDAEVSDDAFTAVLLASTRRERYVQRLAFRALAAAPGKFTVPEDRLLLALRADATSRLAALAAMASAGSTLARDFDALLTIYGIDAPPREGSVAEVPAALSGAPLEAAALVAVLATADDDDAAWAWFQVIGTHGPEAAQAEALRRLRVRAPERAAARAFELLRDGTPVLRAVAAEVAGELLAAGSMPAPARALDWFDALWTAQRELGEIAALEPRLLVLGVLVNVDAALMRLRASALLLDDDRVVRLWAFRNLAPAPGSPAAPSFMDAVGPVDTGRSDDDYRRLAERLLRLQARPPQFEMATARGTLVWELRPDWAPLTALAYLQWVDDGFFEGITFHRVVEDFVIQAGDPTAVGYGGAPGGLRSEETPIPFTAGTVGLALAGRDTGGSQFFVTHSAQPHLNGGYPVLGQVVKNARVIARVQVGDVVEIIAR